MLRACAATLVFLLHFLPHYQAMNGSIELFKAISAWGFTGVDVFFVISGFVIAHTSINKPKNKQSFLTFIKHRLSRIYLGYWPFLLLASVLIYLYQPTKFNSLDIVNSIFLTTSNINQLILPVSWTLSYELMFYVIFSSVFFLRLKYFSLVLISITCLVLLNGYYHPTIDPSNITNHMDFIFSPALLEFFFGVLVYVYRKQLKQNKFIYIGGVCGLLFCTFGVYFDAKLGLFRTFTFGISAMSFLVTALALEASKKAVAGKLFISNGNASYTLYLCHLLWIQLFFVSGVRDFLSNQPQVIIELGSLCFILMVLLFSHLFYLFIEAPLYKTVRDFSWKKTAIQKP